MSTSDYQNNPNYYRHLEAEAVFSEDLPTFVRESMVQREFDIDGPQGQPCPGKKDPNCQGTAWYKATVGAWKCYDCGTLCDRYGEVY